MNTSVIITIKAGEVPNRDYIAKALQQCPTCYGLVVQNEDGEDSSLEIAKDASNLSLDKLMETLEACKDANVVLTLGNMVQDFDKDNDLMPFVFQQGDGETEPENILAIFLEGDASSYCRPGEGHTEIHNLWEDLIFPTIGEKFEASADLPSFFDKLRTSAFKQTVLNSFKHRGVAIFVPVIGDIITMENNEIGAEYSWGTTSNTFGWGDAVKTKPEGTVTKAKSRLSALLGTSSTKTSVPDTKKPETKSEHVRDDKGVHHIISAENKGMTNVKPPAKLQGNARNAWIRLFTETYEGPMPAGSASKDYVVSVPDNILPFAMEDVSTKDQVKQLTKRVKAARAGAAMESAHEQIQDPKVTEKPVINPAKPEPRPASDYLPDLSADDKKGSTDLVIDWATRPADKMPTALEILSRESKWPAFTTSSGIKDTDMLNWQIADIKELAKKFPDAMALAFLEMKSIAIANGAFKEYLDSLAKAPPASGSAKTADVPATQTQEPKKKSRLAMLRGSAAA